MFNSRKKTQETKARQPQQNLNTTTVRSFEGGLNVADTDLNMSPKYAKVLDNLERGLDGTLSLRPGTRRLATLNAHADTSDVVNTYYFNGFQISVQANGTITKTDGTGVVTWMSLGDLGVLTPWPATVEYVSFTIFNSDLLIMDGVNKPLIIAGNPNNLNYMVLQYLVDLASVSNVNTPVGRLCCSHAQYTLIAGIAAEPSTLYISSRGTSGTYPGDGPPNDAIALDLGPRVSLGSAAITGLVAYRDKLLVTFERGVLPINLGVYVGSPAVHTPSDDGFVEEFGCIAHRTLVSVGDDTFYLDNVGVNSIERVTLFNTLRPKRASQLVDPQITALVQALTPSQIDKYVFAVYDMRHSRYMLFIPVIDVDTDVVTETIGYSFTTIPILKVEAWARLRGWVWSCGTRTALQNIVFGRGNKLFSYDFDGNMTHADFVNDTVLGSADNTGIPIAFEWELPWADFQKRMETKQLKYLGLDTTGQATFTVKAYVDNLHTYGGVDAPLMQMQFVGGNIAGYGNTPYGDAPYGGGRTTREERLYAFFCKFKLLKLNFSGSTKLALSFVSVSLAYVRGGIRR